MKSKVKGKQVAGRAKEKLGKLTGNRDLEERVIRSDSGESTRQGGQDSEKGRRGC